jgi:hypothetical protein
MQTAGNSNGLLIRRSKTREGSTQGLHATKSELGSISFSHKYFCNQLPKSKCALQFATKILGQDDLQVHEDPTCSAYRPNLARFLAERWSTQIWCRSARFSSSREASARRIEGRVASSVARKLSIGKENYEKDKPHPLTQIEVFEIACRFTAVLTPPSVLPPRLVVVDRAGGRSEWPRLSTRAHR